MEKNDNFFIRRSGSNIINKMAEKFTDMDIVER